MEGCSSLYLPSPQSPSAQESLAALQPEHIPDPWSDESYGLSSVAFLAPEQTLSVDRERDLLSAASQGDGQAFEELAGHYYGHLRRRALRLLAATPSPEHAAEDVVQDTYLSAFRKVSALEVTPHDEPRRAIRWFYGILRNAALMHFRSRARQSLFADALPLLELDGAAEALTHTRHSDTPAEALSRVHLIQAIQKLIPLLRPAEFEVFVMHYLHDFSYEQVARELGIAEVTVRQYIHKIHARGHDLVAVGQVAIES